jgi:hypothetical protein
MTGSRAAILTAIGSAIVAASTFSTTAGPSGVALPGVTSRPDGRK